MIQNKKIYEAVNIIGDGAIFLKGTRRKLYNYITVEGSPNYIKEYLQKHPDKTVFSISKTYVPELRRLAIATKATNFNKWATAEDLIQFKENRSNFLNNR